MKDPLSREIAAMKEVADTTIEAMEGGITEAERRIKPELAKKIGALIVERHLDKIEHDAGVTFRVHVAVLPLTEYMTLLANQKGVPRHDDE